ncbi:MAG: endonuclease/exonuclease/phosphatase family protein [Acidimicrobiia bacterium]|nr:endonuclease/exonuclease/phosphatase family protein [Acidimicrobiia bacterium]
MTLRDTDPRALVDRTAGVAKTQWTQRGGWAWLFGGLALVAHGLVVVSLIMSTAVTEQIASLLPQVFVLGLILHAMAVGLARTRQALARSVGAIGVVVVFVALVLAPWNQADRAEAGGPSLRLTTYNAYFKNAKPPSLEQTDVIGLQEITSAELDAVARDMGASFTFLSQCQCTASGTEVGLVSRYEITDATYFDDGGSGTFIRATLTVSPAKTIVAYVAHLPSPEDHSARDRRNHLIDVIKGEIDKEAGDVMLLGDIGTTIYSPTFRTLKSDLKLQPVDYGLVTPCSWYGYGPLLCLRIDHILISSGLRIVESSVAADQGSDHRAVSATITW